MPPKRILKPIPPLIKDLAVAVFINRDETAVPALTDAMIECGMEKFVDIHIREDMWHIWYCMVLKKIADGELTCFDDNGALY